MKPDDLVREVQYELGQMQRLAATSRALSELPDDQRRPWDAAAAAKYVADLVLGLENLCRRRYKSLGLGIPEGPESHTRMLEDFLQAPDLGGCLSEEHRQRLKKYLRFRHRFFHGYGHEVPWEVVEEPLRLLADTVHVLSGIWNRWATTEPGSK